MCCMDGAARCLVRGVGPGSLDCGRDADPLAVHARGHVSRRRRDAVGTYSAQTEADG